MLAGIAARAPRECPPAKAGAAIRSKVEMRRPSSRRDTRSVSHAAEGNASSEKLPDYTGPSMIPRSEAQLVGTDAPLQEVAIMASVGGIQCN
jgi:hypothetical protein